MDPMTSAVTTARAAPIQLPYHGATCLNCNRTIVVYAPTPKYAAWPTEYWPVYPPRMFQLDPMITLMKMRIIMWSM